MVIFNNEKLVCASVFCSNAAVHLFLQSQPEDVAQEYKYSGLHGNKMKVFNDPLSYF